MPEGNAPSRTQPASSIADGLKPLPLALLCIVGMLQASMLAVGKIALLNGVPPLANTFWMVLGAGILLCPFVIFNRREFSREKCRYGLIAGTISVALPTALIVYSIPHIGAGLAAVTYAFPPMLTYLISIPMGLEKARMIRFAGMAIAMTGALIIVFPPDSGDINGWMLIAMMAPVSLACGNVYRTLAWPGNAGPRELASYMLLGAAIVTLPVMLLSDSLYIPASISRTADLALWGLMGLTAVMYIFFFYLQKIAGPVYLSQIGYVIVPGGLVYGILLFGESYPLSILAALALIVSGIILVNKRKMKG